MIMRAGRRPPHTSPIDHALGWQPPKGCHLVVRHHGHGVCTLAVAACCAVLPLKAGQDLTTEAATRSALDALADVVLELRDALHANPWHSCKGGPA
jgi:hypothetical protein